MGTRERPKTGHHRRHKSLAGLTEYASQPQPKCQALISVLLLPTPYPSPVFLQVWPFLYTSKHSLQWKESHACISRISEGMSQEVLQDPFQRTAEQAQSTWSVKLTEKETNELEQGSLYYGAVFYTYSPSTYASYSTKVVNERQHICQKLQASGMK